MKCKTCFRSWTSTRECHCSGCCRHFSSLQGFDSHQPAKNDFKCQDPNPRYWKLNEDGVYVANRPSRKPDPKVASVLVEKAKTSASVVEDSVESSEKATSFAKPKGPDSPSWKAGDIGYRAAHYRVKTAKGSPKDHYCIACGNGADQWAYTHIDPYERIDVSNGFPYSVNPDYYVAMCYSCHWRFDRGCLDILSDMSLEAV